MISLSLSLSLSTSLLCHHTVTTAFGLATASNTGLIPARVAMEE